MPNQPTIAAPLSTTDAASQVLAMMAALSGVITDYNPGGQFRTQAESFGSVVEQQSIWVQAAAFQALIYSAMSVFGVTQGQAAFASGTVLFATTSGVPASQNVAISSGTFVSTAGGIQAQTTQSVLLPAGSSGVSVPAVAVVAGAAGNIPVSGITQIITNPGYPLVVSNAAAFGGGSDAEAPTQTLARFAALRASIGLSSPGAIANAAIGVMVSGSSETCLYSTCFEPWTLGGSGSGIARWDLYIDNGAGTASSGLIGAVTSFLNGGIVSGATNAGAAQGVGFRDAGVPFGVHAVTPTVANVSISGTVNPLISPGIAQQAMAAAVSGYFSLPFGAPAEQAQIAAVAANSAMGLLNALSVSLLTVGGSGVTTLTPAATGRVILGTLTFSLQSG